MLGILDIFRQFCHAAGGVFRTSARWRDRRFMGRFFLQLFTWWNGQTLGTRFFTLRKGVRVGEDKAGNVYYYEQGGTRRWVVYKGVVEASAVPPEWYGWLHRLDDEPPSSSGDSFPNATGTCEAYRPDGSILSQGVRPPVSGDYRPWRPE